MIMPTPRFIKNSVRAIPCRALYWDDKARSARYDLRRMFGDWRRDAALRAEANQSYAAYDGGDFIDVGAFVGFYAALLAPKAKAGDNFVLCEPDPRAHPRLFANLACVAATFPHVSISVITVPIGDGGKCEKIAPGDGPAAHYRFGDPRPKATTVIATTTIDDLANSLGLAPAFIKIDVEGAEYNVLRGMRHTLAQSRPTIAIEIHPSWLPMNATADTVHEVLRAAMLIRQSATSNEGHTREIWRHSDHTINV